MREYDKTSKQKKNSILWLVLHWTRRKEKKKKTKHQLQTGDMNCYCQTDFRTIIFSRDPHVKKNFFTNFFHVVSTLLKHTAFKMSSILPTRVLTAKKSPNQMKLLSNSSFFIHKRSFNFQKFLFNHYINIYLVEWSHYFRDSYSLLTCYASF